MATTALAWKIKFLYREQSEIPKLIEIDDPRLKQTWDKHYIDLPLLSRPTPKEIGNHKMDETMEIDLKNIFDSDNSLEIKKLLLLGGGGAGKSTFLHYICFKWEKLKLFGNKFDIILWIRLKYLLNDRWKSDDDLKRHLERKNKLACFIYYNLKIQYFSLKRRNKSMPEKDQVTIDEIVNIATKMKVLLLVDDYNEVSHLAKCDDAIDFIEIMNAIYENDYIIMSSRPNALKMSEVEKFDRILESKGVDFYNVTTYINSFYSDDEMLAANLISFLERNHQVRGICEIPINIVLLCLIWSDENIRKVFQTNLDINIHLLYCEVIFWLGKRYLVKFENWLPENIKRSNIFQQEIIQFLQNIAFQSFVKGGNFVNKEIVDSHLGTLKLENIYNFGILRATDELTELGNADYFFIHLTFQEFFTALCLKIRLCSEHGENVQNSCNLIGHHRNEPKYLTVLKFLAGITVEGEEELVKRTWEAFTCNVDGMLEFGLETKITLLMHLLEQSKVNGDFDQRIENVELIKTVIEDEVLKDISKWQEHLIESGFVSNKIKEQLFLIIKKSTEYSLELRIAVEIAMKLVSKMLPDERQIIFSKITDFIKSSDWQLQKLGLQTISFVTEKETASLIVEDVLKLTSDKNVKEFAINCLLTVTNLFPDLIKVVVTCFNNVVTDNNFNDEITISAIEFIVKFLKIGFIKIFKNRRLGMDIIFKDKTWKKDMISKDLLQNKQELIRRSKNAIEIIYRDGLGMEIINLLKSIFKISKLNPNVRYFIMQNIISALKQCSYEDEELFIRASNKLISDFVDSLDNFGSTDAECLVELIDWDLAALDYNFKYKIFDKFFILLKNSKDSSCFNDWISHLMLKFLQIVRIVEVWVKVCDVFSELVDIIKSDQLEDEKKIVVVNEIPSYIEFICHFQSFEYDETIQSQVKIIFDSFEEIIKNSTTSPNLQIATVCAIESLFKHLNNNHLLDEHSPLAQPSFQFIKKIYTLFCESLQNPNESIFKDTALAHVASILQFILPHVREKLKLFNETMSFLKDLIENQDISDCSKSKALTVMADLIELSPFEIKYKSANEVCILYLHIINNNKVSQLVAAIQGVGKTIKHASPELQSQLVEKLLEFLFKCIVNEKVQYGKEPCIKCASVQCISEIIPLLSDKETRALEVCNLLINENESKHSKIISKLVIILALNDSIQLITSANPIFREAIIEGLANKLKSKDFQPNFRKIGDIINVINLCKEQSELEKNLYDVATKILENICDEIEEDGIKWITENVDKMPSVIETQQFLKRLCRQVLSTLTNFNESHTKFIIKCIEYGLTVTIKRKHQHELVFENVSYAMSDEVDLESVISAALKQDNILAKQYREYVPLFKNRGIPFGLPVAASDFLIKSLVNDGENDNYNAVGCENWHLSLLRFSDQNKSEPSAVFLLIEVRDQFGYYLLYKVDLVNGEIRVNPFKPRHPSEINPGLCRQIFGDMQYDIRQLKKPRYYASLINFLPSKEHQQLINTVKEGKELISSDILYQYFKHVLDVSWEEYKIDKGVKGFKKASLLKLDDAACDIARRDSLVIDEQMELQNKIQSLEVQLHKSDKMSQDDKVKIQQQLDSLKQQFSGQKERLKCVTQKMFEMDCKGELIDEKIFLFEHQQQCGKSNQMAQFNDPSVNYYVEKLDSNTDCDLDLC